jgi:hypothetical protein
MRMELMLLIRIEYSSQKHIPADGGITKQTAVDILQYLLLREVLAMSWSFSANKG